MFLAGSSRMARLISTSDSLVALQLENFSF
jgi:hypothetical protein